MHALKNYFGMVNILKDFPRIKATFNLVPSMLVQLEEYCRGGQDIFQDHFRKEPEKLDSNEIAFIARHFFSANYENLIKPYARYNYLYDKKKANQNIDPSGWKNIFSAGELRDIQVWFDLAHFDEDYKQNDKVVKDLIKKGENFSEQDKNKIEEKELELINRIIPEYKRFSESGQIEISTSPFYHPILPLLIDPQEGKNSAPYLPDYDLKFNWKEDAISQLELALDYMKRIFGKVPKGIWPSEGSLSQEVIHILNEFGIKWTATDEINLSKSLKFEIKRNSQGIVDNPEKLYRPYTVSGMDICIFFRDRLLSDLIGFEYQKWPAKEAAIDLVKRIKAIPFTENQDVIVPLILDGENPWEYYSRSGRDFLEELFKLIQEDTILETITFSEATKMEAGHLKVLESGSWINGDFNIWIGDKEDLRAWKLLQSARNEVSNFIKNNSDPRVKEVRDLLFAAEGSDWFWWFGKEHYTSEIDVFDNLFRLNLQKIFELTEGKMPEDLLKPVSEILRKKS